MVINRSQLNEKVRKMIFRLTPDDALKAIKSVSDDFPEAMEKIFIRASEKQRLEIFNALIRQIPEDKLIELAEKILDGDKQKSTK